MENIFIEFLPPWVETGLQPAFYDKESGTVLQQVSRMYPKINELIKSNNELGKEFVKLHDYVHDYFDNLDVQEEVNNKLDDMAESGDLATIIAQFLEMSPVFAYRTIAEMAGADNLADGCIAKVLGKTNADTGDGSFYRIRTKTGADTPDGVNLVAITGDNTIIAQIIPNYYYNQLQPIVADNAEFVSRANNRKVIIIGDSYANRDNSWADRIKTKAQLSNANCNIRKYSGVGFINTVDGKNFGTLLTDNITIPSDEVTDIIVCGGWNDNGQTDANIINAIHQFVNTARSTYPNSTVYIGYISWFDCEYPGISSIVPYENVTHVRDSYIKGANYGTHCKYLNNVEYSLHLQDNIDDSHFHPTANGQEEIANNVMRAWLTGSTNVHSYLNNFTSTFTPATNITKPTGNFYGIIDNQISRLLTNGRVTFSFDEETMYNLSGSITLGKITGGYVIGRGSNASACTVSLLISTRNNGYFKIPGRVAIDKGVLTLEVRCLNRNGNGWVSDTLNYIDIDLINISVDSIQQY